MKRILSLIICITMLVGIVPCAFAQESNKMQNVLLLVKPRIPDTNRFTIFDSHITTEGSKVYCETCGYLTSLDERYAFTGDFRFATLAQWYDWQKSLFEKEIAGNKKYALTSNVELRLPGSGSSLTRHGGSGVCTLNREGLTYTGTKDCESVTLHFSLQRIYRLLFGAGENFEVYDGTQIRYFVPEERRSAVDWYMASMILHDMEETAGE